MTDDFGRHVKCSCYNLEYIYMAIIPINIVISLCCSEIQY